MNELGILTAKHLTISVANKDSFEENKAHAKESIRFAIEELENVLTEMRVVRRDENNDSVGALCVQVENRINKLKKLIE